MVAYIVHFFVIIRRFAHDENLRRNSQCDRCGVPTLQCRATAAADRHGAVEAAVAAAHAVIGELTLGAGSAATAGIGVDDAVEAEAQEAPAVGTKSTVGGGAATGDQAVAAAAAAPSVRRAAAAAAAAAAAGAAAIVGADLNAT